MSGRNGSAGGWGRGVNIKGCWVAHGSNSCHEIPMTRPCFLAIHTRNSILSIPRVKGAVVGRESLFGSLVPGREIADEGGKAGE